MTPAERALATNYRQNQVRVEAAATLALQTAWRIIDPEDLADTVPLWVPAALNVVDRAHTQSAALARAYIRTARRTFVGAEPAGVLPRPVFNADAARTSLTVRGPLIIERARRLGLDVDNATRLAQAESARAGSRHAVNGGRATVTEYTRTDPRAGWRRITAATACSFCSMLAGRGAVYRAETVDFNAHDGCNCQPGMEFAT